MHGGAGEPICKDPCRSFILGDGRTAIAPDLFQRLIAATVTALPLALLLFLEAIAIIVIMIAANFDADFYAAPAQDLSALWLAIPLTLLIYLGRQIYLLARNGQTRGMRHVKHRLVRFSTGMRPTLVAASIRTMVPTLPLVIGIGTAGLLDKIYPLYASLVAWFVIHISVRWSRRWQAWQDKLAGTVLIVVD